MLFRAIVITCLLILSIPVAVANTTPTPGPTTVADLACSSGTASKTSRKVACSNILYVNDGASYVAQGNLIFNALKTYVDARLLADAVCTGLAHGVTMVYGMPNLPADLSIYSQVWVYDLRASSEPASYIPKWQSIAQWFEAGYPSQRQDIILDGRILSSAHGSGLVAPNHWQLFYNYFENLRNRGGGLMLGTDHGSSSEAAACGVFTCGTNTVTAALNIGGFWGSFTGPKVAYVDVGSPLMNFPLDASELAAPRGKATYTCTDPAHCVVGTVFDRIVWDHTSTSQPAIGLQPNGMTFYAVAFHSQNTDRPAISTTIRGMLNFQVAIVEPSCDQCYVVGDSVTITIGLQVPSLGPYTEWTAYYLGHPTSDFTVAADGLSASHTTLPLLEGTYGFEVQVTDAQGSIAKATVRVSVRKSCVCENPVDLLFIIDESQSVGSENYDKTVDFVKNMVSETATRRARFQVGAGLQHAQIAMVKFATLSTLSFDLDDHLTNSAVTTAMAATQYQPSSDSCPGYSMQMATDQVLCAACPGRGAPRNAPVTVIFLTDGDPGLVTSCQSANVGTTMNRVNEIIRLKGLVDRIIPVGIGSGVSAAYLQGLAKNMAVQSNGNNFLSAEYANLASLTAAITDAACPISPPTQAPTRTPTGFPTAAPTRAPTVEPSLAPTPQPSSAPTFDCDLGCSIEQIATCDMIAGRPGTCGFTSAACDTAKCGCAGGYSCSTTNCTVCTAAPTRAPTSFPTTAPSLYPTAEPSFAPTNAPSFHPTNAPSAPTNGPTYWDLFQSGQENKDDAAATTAAGVAGAAIGTVAIILIILAVIAAVIILVAMAGGIGIFAARRKLFNLDGLQVDGEVVTGKAIACGSEIEMTESIAKGLLESGNITQEQFAEMGFGNPPCEDLPTYANASVATFNSDSGTVRSI